MSGEDLIRQAEQALASGAPERALGLAGQAEASGAPRAACLRVQGRALLALGRFQEAERALTAAMELRPDDASSYAELARLHLAAGRVAKAQVLLERAVELDPRDASLRTDLDRVRQMSGRRRAGRRGLPVWVWGIIGGVDLAVLAVLLLWAFGLLGKPGTQAGVQAAPPAQTAQPPVAQTAPQQPPQPPVAQTSPQAPAQRALTQAPKPTSPQASVTQPVPEQQAQPEVTQAPPPRPPAPKVASVPAAPAPPPPPPPPQQGPKARILWLRCREVPELEVHAEGRVRRVFQMWGEVLNESDQVLPVAVIRGVLLAGNQAAGYGLAEVQNVPPRGKASFNFYAYQLAPESAPKPGGYDALLIPGFSLDQGFKQLGAYGNLLEQLLMGGGLQ